MWLVSDWSECAGRLLVIYLQVPYRSTWTVENSYVFVLVQLFFFFSCEPFSYIWVSMHTRVMHCQMMQELHLHSVDIWSHPSRIKIDFGCIHVTLYASLLHHLCVNIVSTFMPLVLWLTTGVTDPSSWICDCS